MTKPQYDLPVEEIVVRGRAVFAERLYVSERGDYIVYKYRGKTYRVDREADETDKPSDN